MQLRSQFLFKITYLLLTVDSLIISWSCWSVVG
jgi:hypothetical protein